MLVRPLTEEEKEKRGWRVEVNGEVVSGVSSARLVNEKMGIEITYGMRSEGFDGALIHEPGGGGSVIVPWFVKDKEVYIGLLEQNRPTLQDNRNVPRGFLDPGENHFQTATREFVEETGFVDLKDRVVEIPGPPINSNSTWFDTSRPGEGVKFY
ncbi:MAG: NUDIX domain-containing protein [Candidatus Spechtbacterales bacterium]